MPRLGLLHPACLLLALIVFPTARAQTTPPSPASDAAVDAVFQRYDNTYTPGCSVAVVDAGKVLLKKSYGMADPSLGVPMGSSTSVWIPYSEARVFVALAVAMLARDGELGLDDPIRRHVPQLPAYASDVTVRHLMHHTSGLADYGVLAGPGWELEDRTSEDEVFRMLARWGKLGFAPGQGQMYSNTDYALLKMLVERVTGASLHDFLHARLLGPIGMSATRIGADQADIHPGHALFYRPDGNGFKRVLRYRISPTGGISVTTSLDDLLRWERALRDPRLGLAVMLRELESGAPTADADAGETGFQFGVYRRTHKGMPLVEYRGTGWYTYLIQVPDTRLSVATLCLTNQDTGWLGAEVARLYVAPAPADSVNATTPPPALGPPVAVPVSELLRYVGEYRNGSGRFRVDVDVRNDRLGVTPRGQESLPALTPLGNGQFRTEFDGSTYLMEFKDAADGMTLSTWDITLNEPGGETLRRWTPLKPVAGAMDGYPGIYVGDDVEVTLHLRLDGDRVLVATRGMAEAALEPADAPDVFQGPSIYTTRFERDATGRVVALVLDANRVKGVRFTRR